MKSNSLQNSLFDDDFFQYKFPQPQYLGSKYKFTSWIGSYIPNDVQTIADPFAGSQSISFYLKQCGYTVFTNDFMNFSFQIGKGLVENTKEILTAQDIQMLFETNSNPSYYDLIETVYANIFFKSEECKIIDTFRSNVDKLPPLKRALALSIMNRALTRKITMGHFAHLKALEYASNPTRVKRNASLVKSIYEIFMDLLPEYNACIFDNGYKNKAFHTDAIEMFSSIHPLVDLVYFDPPYVGSHADYQSFYHLLETVTEYWKDKEFRTGTRSYHPKRYSGFDTKKTALPSFEKLFSTAQYVPYWIVSYNNRSYPNEKVFFDLLSKYKKVIVQYKTYENCVGGKGSVKNSKELLFICSPK